MVVFTQHHFYWPLGQQAAARTWGRERRGQGARLRGRPAVSCRAVSSRGVSSRGVSSRAVSSRALSSRAVSSSAVSSRALSSRALSSRDVSSRAVSSRAVSSRALSSRAVSSRALSSRAVSSRAVYSRALGGRLRPRHLGFVTELASWVPRKEVWRLGTALEGREEPAGLLGPRCHCHSPAAVRAHLSGVLSFGLCVTFLLCHAFPALFLDHRLTLL